ncbi:MAG: AsmA-like C-terminal region-containing protein, partial [Haliea sp.]|nr:AsmA-like C-terminal region-containing protein [Haliea sp.]
GELRLEQGDIRVPQLAVAGAGSSFRFSGRSDFASRQLDGELVATLPVANNLPWVAALAGGLPVAAGVFVVSKLFEKQVSQLSSAVYAISGTWQEPVVRLDRIFDTSNVVAPEPQPAPLTRPAEAVSQDASSVPSASSEGVSSTEAESSSRK